MKATLNGYRHIICPRYSFEQAVQEAATMCLQVDL